VVADERAPVVRHRGAVVKRLATTAAMLLHGRPHPRAAEADADPAGHPATNQASERSQLASDEQAGLFLGLQ
jgi:hypothetical protein